MMNFWEYICEIPKVLEVVQSPLCMHSILVMFMSIIYWLLFYCITSSVELYFNVNVQLHLPSVISLLYNTK